MLLFYDGFDHYATAGITTKWTGQVDGNCFIGTIQAAGGRNGTQSLRANWVGFNSTGGYVRKTLAPSDNECYVGFGFRTTILPAALAQNPLGAILLSGTPHLRLDMNASGNLVVLDNAHSTLLTSSVALSINTYYYVELAATIANSGSVTLYVNGTAVGSYSGDTQNGGTAAWDGWEFGRNFNNSTTTGTYDFDDFYINDGSGADNNSVLGPVRVTTSYPDGAGNSTDFTPSAGSNFQNVDEALTDGDTTYNTGTTPGDHDTYAMSAVGVTGTVFGVQTNLMVRSNGGGAETIRPKIRISGTDYNGTTTGVTTSYADVREIFERSPATSNPWDITEIDGAEVGLELVS